MRLNIKRRQKYNAKPTEYKGRKYDSKAEAMYASQLDALKDGGEIYLRLRQTPFDLGEDTRYRADFFVIEGNGDFYAVDVKGVETQSFKKIKKLWVKYAEMPLHIVKKNKVVEVLCPK